METKIFLSVGNMAKRFDLSRSTLIYYEEIGLLKPSQRTAANYRVYVNKDIEQMERIQLYRSTGVSLKEIKELLSNPISSKSETKFAETFEQRLGSINDEIKSLRQQQRILIKLLKTESAQLNSKTMTKEIWSDMLRSAGLDEVGMLEWHIQYEKSAPQAHQDFLQSLGLDDEEIANIRKKAKKS